MSVINIVFAFGERNWGGLYATWFSLSLQSLSLYFAIMLQVSIFKKCILNGFEIETWNKSGRF